MAPDALGMSGPVAVRVRKLARRFGERTILGGVDLEIRRGEFVALLGRSGSGKSTFLRALAGLDDDTAGSGEIEVPTRRSVVFQDARLLPWKRVLDNVAFGLKGPSPRERARRALYEVGLAARARAWPVELSGGEQQRAALARSLVREPELLLADEPFGALDALTRIRMQDLMLGLVARHRPAVLLVTHDVDEAIHMADRVLVLDEGRFAVDQPIALSGPSPQRDEQVAELRLHLLACLGVHTQTRRAA
jgi:sulfonate transport system ATP-binding protein